MDRTRKRDGQTDGRTDGQCDYYMPPKVPQSTQIFAETFTRSLLKAA